MSTHASRAALRLSIIGLAVSLGACDIAPREAVQSDRGREVDEGPYIRYRADTARNRVWTLTHEGVRMHEARTRASVLVALPSWQWVGAPYACPPDLAIGPDGEALVTSNIAPTVWRIHPRTLRVTVHALSLSADADKDVGFSTLKYSAEHRSWLAASTVHGTWWRIDADLVRAEKVELFPKPETACLLDALPPLAAGVAADAGRARSARVN